MNFVFKPTTHTYTDPQSAVFTQAIPYGREYSKGDVALIDDKLPGSKIILNSVVLKKAMLDSKEFFRDYLGLEVSEVVKAEPLTKENYAEPVVEETVEEAKPVVKKSKKKVEE